MNAPLKSSQPLRELIIDCFAGGGGASTGIEIALGRSPDIAINHNEAALALHAANHPETIHLNSNIWDVSPTEVCAGRPVGLLWASPDCKHFSKAKGGKPLDRNIRDLAWVVVRWAEEVKPKRIFLENVEEFITWGPLYEDGSPIAELRGHTFGHWVGRLKAAGYKVQWRELRGCDYGAPTIRKRLFVIARRDGERIVWPKPTHGDPRSAAVRPGKLKPWRIVAECIDWTLPCPSIFDTAAEVFAKLGLRAIRPLADNTMARIARGFKRHVIDEAKPFMVTLTHGARVEAIDEPSRTITGANRGERAIVTPSMVSLKGSDRRDGAVGEPHPTIRAGGGHSVVVSPSLVSFNGDRVGQDMRAPAPTITANSFIKRPGGAAPVGVMAPHLCAYYGEGEGGNNRSADLRQPIHVIPTENRHALIVPVITAAQQGGTNRRADQPIHTITASKKDQNCVVTAHMMTMRNAGQPCGAADAPARTITAGGAGETVVAAFMAQHNNDSRRIGGVNPGRSADEPLATVTQTGSQQGVVSAYLVPRYGERVGQEPRSRSIESPAPVVVPTGNGGSLVAPLITRQFGASVGHGVDEPSATITAGVNKSALVAPCLTKYYGQGEGQRADEPCHTVTVRDRFGHVEAALAAPPFLPEMEPRARQVADFLRAYGCWDEREFVTLEVDGFTFVVVDIGMRMLTPRELYNAQGFPADYEIERGADGRVFPKSVQVSCVGNSVCPPVAAAIVAANCQDLVEMQEAAE